ncbi:uncharacterized protein LOC136095559 [Hydra vulgaris]|uniref:uncharacterized protein LOC136095559 n=1 Tax=Hydra vulgaris TaxID=6087 RepID=UPI0032E9F6DE
MRHPFHKKSNWSPPMTKNKTIINYLNLVECDITALIFSQLPKDKKNLTPKLIHALNSLMFNPTIIIKKADKGGGICILDKTDYEEKISLLLSDKNTYKLLSEDPTKSIARDVNNLIDYMFLHHMIDKKTSEFLRPKTPHRTPLFYGLPKIHKIGTPLRPIVSGCDGPIDNLSFFITEFIQPVAEQLPAYFKDTTHFLTLLQSHVLETNNYILVTADVISLYTNIPHREGIDAVKFYLKRAPPFNGPIKRPPIAFIDIILETILTHSNFQFSTDHFLQLTGTTMGTRMAPPYANLFMGRIDEKIIDQFSMWISFYKRFIDDIFFIFHGPPEILTQVFEFMNAIHPTIKFTFNNSTTSIHFMDLTINKKLDGQLETTIYKKATDTTALLHYNSFHPPHQKSNLIYSQALRYNKNISNNYNLIKELKQLAQILVIRGYPIQSINKGFKQALRHTQHELINNKYKEEREKEKILPMVTTFGKVGKLINKIVKKHWNIVEQDTDLKNIWPTPPIASFKNIKSIKKFLIQTAHKKT